MFFYSGSMFGMTHDQIEATITVNYPRLLKKAGKWLTKTKKKRDSSRCKLETRKLTYNAVVSLDKDQLLQQEDNKNKRKDNNQQQQSKKQKKQKKAINTSYFK